MIEIREVHSRSELRKFVNYPNVLYRDVPQYVPAMIGDDLSDWNPKKNPAFAYCEAKCWLALRDGKVVGRIGAILSKRANEKGGLTRYTARWASPTWIGRACWWRASTAWACSSPTTTTPITSTT